MIILHAAVLPLWPVMLSYVLSFVFIGIYWNNHHHLMHVVQHVNGRILWANLHLLFWLSLIPFVTSWMDESNFAPWPIAISGVVLLFAGVAYYVLVRALLARHGKDSILARAVGNDFKGKLSMVIYACAIPLAFVHIALATGLYALVALMWLVPDLRIERVVNSDVAQ